MEVRTVPGGLIDCADQWGTMKLWSPFPEPQAEICLQMTSCQDSNSFNGSETPHWKPECYSQISNLIVGPEIKHTFVLVFKTQ